MHTRHGKSTTPIDPPTFIMIALRHFRSSHPSTETYDLKIRRSSEERKNKICMSDLSSHKSLQESYIASLLRYTTDMAVLRRFWNRIERINDWFSKKKNYGGQKQPWYALVVLFQICWTIYILFNLCIERKRRSSSNVLEFFLPTSATKALIALSIIAITTIIIYCYYYLDNVK